MISFKPLFAEEAYDTAKIKHSLPLFYIVVCDSHAGLQFTHMIVNPTNA